MNLHRGEYLQLLRMCNSLRTQKGEPSSLVYEILERLCKVYKNSCNGLSTLPSEYISETDMALSSLREYALSVDNWKVEGCLFGLRDQCAILGSIPILQKDKREGSLFATITRE